MTLFTSPPGAGGAAAETAEPVPAGGAARPRRRMRINALGLLGLVIIIAVCLFCFVGPLVYHTNQVASNLAVANDPPGAGHPLGTDDNGFDILGRLMVGGQSSIEIGAAVAVLATSFGVIWGAIAGFVGGIVDSVMMRIVDVILAIPPLFLLLFLASCS
jgi:peptide/nickel transport system permease protein